MPKQAQRANVNAFIKGVITEASPLNFPANASTDELNFEIKTDGTRRRRLGMDYEDGYNFSATVSAFSLSVSNTQTFLWDSVNGDSSLSFLAVQLGAIVYFYDSYATSMSSTGFKGQINLTSILPTNVLYSFASVDGKLIVTGGNPTIALVTYNATAGTFSATSNRLLVRDLWGIEETVEPRYETDPSFRGDNNAQHYYNLQNQSWGIARKDAAGVLGDPQVMYAGAAAGGVVPSNSEQVWPALQFQASATPFERIYPNLWDEVLGGTTKAAKGYFIIDLLDRSNSRAAAFAANKVKYPSLAAGVATPTTDSTSGGASVVCDFAGRIFYAGFNGALVNGDARSPILNNYIVFSQLVKSRSDFFKCYQDGDPTSRDEADIVATDGGFIRISGAKNITAMRNLGTSLVVFADNGVWTVTGGQQDSGFDATNYKVNKISTFGAIAPTSIVNEGGSCYYWSNDGIFIIGKDQFGDLECKSLTNGTIQSLYRDISTSSKLNSKGAYDSFRSKVRWIYNTGDAFDPTSKTYELVFDSLLNAWTRNLISLPADNSLAIFGIFKTQPFYTITSDQSTELQTLKYLVLKHTGTGVFSATFAYYHNQQFLDWKINDGVGIDAKAYILTGQETASDPAVDKQIPYLQMFFERTEKGVDANFQPMLQSSCMYRVQWDFANSIISNRWSPLREAYRYKKPLLVESLSDTYDNGFEVIYTKNKLRGKGRAFSLYFETSPGKDCHILGWSITLNAESIT
jgi:hypothetical protein